MRDLINIIESHSGVPDFSQFVTPELVNKLISHGLWSDHGSELSVWWEEGAGDYMSPEDFANKIEDFDDALQANPELVKNTLLKFLQARTGFIDRIMSGEYGDEPITPTTVISRIIMVDEKFIEQLEAARNTTVKLGVFWGAGEVEPWGAKYDNINKTPYGLKFATEIRHTQVDWKATFLSRIDWQNGDEEHEIQLVPGSPIRIITEIKIDTSNADPSYVGRVIKIDPSVHFTA